MKYKEFVAWCNDRACDGRWGISDALGCVDIMRRVNKKIFWNREKEWQKIDTEYGISKNILKRE